MGGSLHWAWIKHQNRSSVMQTLIAASPGFIAVPWEIISMLGKGVFCPQKGFPLQKEHTDGETEAGLTPWHPSPPSAAG